MSDANRVGLRYIEEVTWGVTPATPVMQAMRFTDESLNFNIENTQSQESRDDRAVADTVQVSASGGGGVNFEFSAASFDDMLEGALWDTWATDVLKNGTVKKSYSIEKAMLDVDEFFTYTGMVVGNLGLTIRTGSIVTGNVSFLGKGCALAQLTGAQSVTAVNTNAVMNAMTNVGSIQEGGSALTGVYLQEIGFNINNNLRTINEIGSATLGAVGGGTSEISGTLTAYFTSARLYDKFLAGTETSLTFTLSDDAGNSYAVLLPRVKFETDDVAHEGINTDLWENISWRALHDETEGCQIKITRSLV